jgi:hypothetical protein
MNAIHIEIHEDTISSVLAAGFAIGAYEFSNWLFFTSHGLQGGSQKREP